MFRRLLVLVVAITFPVVTMGCQFKDENEAMGRAEELFVSGQADLAKSAFEDFVRTYPDSRRLPDALMGLAKLEHFHLQKHQQAIASYRRIAALFPDHEVAHKALDNMVQIYMIKLKDYHSAIKVLQRLKRDYCNDNDSLESFQNRIAWSYFTLEMYPEARKTYEDLLAISAAPEQKEAAMVGIADTYYVQDFIPEALAAYETALVAHPQGVLTDRIKFRVANCLEEGGKLKQAKLLYRKLLKTYPNPEAVRIRLAGVNTRLKKGAR